MTDKYIVVDADTIIVKSAMSVQTNYCVYKDGKFVCQTPSRKQWMADNKTTDTEGLEFRKEARLVPHGSEHVLLSRCKTQIRNSFKAIQDKYPERKMIIVLEAEGNFREHYYPEYKAQRDGDILMRKKLSQWVGKEFKNVQFAVGEETDDICSKFQWKGYKDYIKTGEYSFIVSSCDKDSLTTCGKVYNYCKDEEYEISPLEATRFFCYQILIGDSVDNVLGLNSPISKELAAQLGVKHNSKGVGETTANNILAPCQTEKECFERVILCYKDVYGDKWLEKMQFEAFPLRMRRVKDEMYDLKKHLDYLGIEYE